MNAEPRRRRSGGRANAREPAPIPQLAASHVRNPYPPMRVLSDDQVEAIHDTSMHILENLGIEMMSAAALDVFARSGAKVDRAARRP